MPRYLKSKLAQVLESTSVSASASASSSSTAASSNTRAQNTASVSSKEELLGELAPSFAYITISLRANVSLFFFRPTRLLTALCCPVRQKNIYIVKRADTHSLDDSTRWTIPGDAVVATQVGGRYKVWVVLGSGAPRVADFARWS